MAYNLDWYPVDFESEGEELTVLDAIDRIEIERVNAALIALATQRELYWNLIENQNFAIPHQDRSIIPGARLPELIYPESQDKTLARSPIIVVHAARTQSVDFVEGANRKATWIRVDITALADDLTIYGILADNHAHWTLEFPDEDGILNMSELPIVLPKNTSQSFYVALSPTRDVVSNNVSTIDSELRVVILSNAINASSQSGESEANQLFLTITNYPEHQNLDSRYFNSYYLLHFQGKISPHAGPSSISNTRFFYDAAPYQTQITSQNVPFELDLGSRGYAIAGIENHGTSLLGFDFFSETVFAARNLTKPREWCGAVGNSCQFYVVGGGKDNRKVNFDSIDRYNMENDNMFRLSQTLAQASDLISGAAAKNSGYLFGGDSTSLGTVSSPTGKTTGYGTTDRIDKINFTTESLHTLGATLNEGRTFWGSVAGNSQKLWLFGGASRYSPNPTINLYDHTVDLTGFSNNEITEFDVSTESTSLLGAALPFSNSWRNATAGNRYKVYIAGGCSGVSNPQSPSIIGLSTNTIQSFDIGTATLSTLGITLAASANSMYPMGGSKKIYYAGGFDDGANSLETIQKLNIDPAESLNTLVTISTTLPTAKGGGAGISNYAAGH